MSSLYTTPIFTSAGVIYGTTFDGDYITQSRPSINLADFFNQNQYSKPVKSYCIGEIMQKVQDHQQEIYRKLDEKKNSLKSSTQIEAEKTQHEELSRIEAEKKKQNEELARIETEKKKQHEELARIQAEKKKQHEELARIEAEKKKQHEELARIQAENIKAKTMKKLTFAKYISTYGDISDTTSQSSRVSSASSVQSSVASSVRSSISSIASTNSDSTWLSVNSDDSDSNSDSGSDSNSDSGSTVSSMDSTSTINAIKDLNGKSKYSNCNIKSCTKCHNGVSSVGCIFMHNDKPNNEYKFIIGKGTIDNLFSEFSQKIKAELPTERASKLLKRLIKFDFDFDDDVNKSFIDYIDIKLKDDLHVHRVFIINFQDDCDSVDTFDKKESEISELSIFSFKKIVENTKLFKSCKIINKNGVTCNINKRLKRFFEIFANVNSFVL